MAQSNSRKRPWLAALLAVLVTGLGHLYLRRWRRALGWLASSFLVTVLFVDPAAVDELSTGAPSLETLLTAAPMLVVAGLSTLDAYVLARARHSSASATALPSDAADDAFACPHCGKALDPELEFCHWCTRSVADAEPNRESTNNE
ncbi:zinc ribbon domain-containing protein [Natrinema salaciae]|uniref:DUF7575 domain-containing protein n=1 Tax=Natrinema salaciae TaxID=1186196 RepID=A0A1H9NHL8_9EURY|nr:zinc ribbon domain-containing protein [Natrinema salaciae]SER35391.1 hypothetical protein SAMN04489841_3603 [Natrinema salaciae]